MATWKVTQLERNVSDGLVVKVSWRIEIVQGDVNEFTVGDTVLGPRGSDFIEFETLTEQGVISWLQALPELLAFEADVTARAQAAQTPATVVGLPW